MLTNKRAYTEPGAFLKLVDATETNNTATSNMVPLFIGTAGNYVFKNSNRVTRGEASTTTGSVTTIKYDSIDVDGNISSSGSEPSNIVSLGFRPDQEDFVAGELTKSSDIYTLTDSEPSDWSKNYKSYYTVATYAAVTGSTAPVWVAKKYFSKSGNVYTLTTTQPADWATTYTSYYTAATYAAVTGSTAPTWVVNTYYSKHNPVIGVTNDYATEVIYDSATKKSTINIYWSVAGCAKIFTGSYYYVKYKLPLGFGISEVMTISDASKITETLGEYTYIEGTGSSATKKINQLALAVYLALTNGAPYVYALPISEPSGTETYASLYAKALADKAAFVSDIWRIVPVDMPKIDQNQITVQDIAEYKSIHAAVDTHITACSSYEERKERTAIYGFVPANSGEGAATTKDDRLQATANYASTKNNHRITVVYPSYISVVIPGDSTFTEVGPQFLAAAYTGREASIVGYLPKTRTSLQGIYAIGGDKLSRSEMNALASYGVMIITQEKGEGSEVLVRHQLTTASDESAITKGISENSIVYIRDYCSKVLRAVCEQYIGTGNINNELIARIKGSLNSQISALKTSGYIIDGEITDIAQNPEKRGSIFVNIAVAVPYPCNTIELTLYVE